MSVTNVYSEPNIMRVGAVCPIHVYYPGWNTVIGRKDGTGSLVQPFASMAANSSLASQRALF